jgi:hypothetical protein
MESAGIVISTEDFMLQRLSNAVLDGHLTDNEMAEIIENSPLQYVEGKIRSGKFYLTGTPQPIDDFGIRYLLNVWGGEVVNMHLKEHGELWQRLQQIGRPRIIEVASPLALCGHHQDCDLRVIQTFADSVGCPTRDEGIDFWIGEPLSPEAILAIHTEGDEAFQQMARGYPIGYVERQIDEAI